MTLTFVGGPSDGHSENCPLAPPPIFFLPTSVPLTASIYLFDSVMAGNLKYSFGGYRLLSDKEEQALFRPAITQI